VVSGVRTSSSTLWDSRAAALDAAAKGRLGLAAAQTYAQSAATAAAQAASSVSSAGSTAASAVSDAVIPQTQTEQDATSGQSAGGQTATAQDQDTSGALPSFQLAASYGQMLAAQEAGSQAAEASPLAGRPDQASSAYNAAMALTDQGASDLDMQMPGWSDSAISGQRINLSA